MSDHARNDIDRSAEGDRGPGLPAALSAAFLVAAFVCAAFTAAGAAVVGIYEISRGLPEGAGFVVKLAIKTVLFGVIGAGSAYALHRHTAESPVAPNSAEKHGRQSASWPTRLLVLAGLAATAALVFPKLNAYPWIAPDESHHLIVARNIALYDQYASGHPSTGLKPFDAYDSVGAPVILPVAAALRLGGVSAGTGRAPIALYACLLFLTAYAFAAPVFGARAAALGALMLLMAGSTVYLSRTLYGEVPAVFYLILGLTLWRRALNHPGWRVEGFLAGLCFGAAVLCKAILLLSAFAFLGTWVYDLATARRIRVRHIAAPAIGFAFIYGAWSTYEIVAGGGAASGIADILALYQPLLLFGFNSVGHTLRFLLREPTALATAVGGILVGAAILFRRRYDPPAIVLVMTAALYIYWWTFFTEGHLPRYLWLGYGPAAVFAGLLLDTGIDALHTRRQRWPIRLAWIAVIAVVAVPAVAWTAQQVSLVYTCDETHDERALAEYVRTLPTDAQVGSTYYPVCRTLDFLTNRPVTLLTDPSSAPPPCAIVIINVSTQPGLARNAAVTHVVGRYAVVKRED